MSLIILDIFKLLNSKLPKDLYIPFKDFFKIWDDKSIFSISIIKFNFSIKSRSKSFNDFINQINENFSQEQKLEMISFLWHTAYADNVLEVDEERLIRRIADMIRIKNMQVLKLKDQAKQNS